MSKKALIVWADGMEEIEAITPVDLLRRAKVEVIIAGLKSLKVKSARGVAFQAEILLEQASEEVDALILPGGLAGSENLAKSEEIQKLILRLHAKGKWIAAICAAPALVLAKTGILAHKRVTGYPGYETHFASNVQHSADRVVVDGNILTSRGAGTSYEFSLALVEKLTDKATAESIAKATLFYS